MHTGRPLRTGTLLLTVLSNVQHRIYKSSVPASQRPTSEMNLRSELLLLLSHTQQHAQKKLRGKLGVPKGRGLQGGSNRSLKITEFCKQYDIKTVLRDLLPTAESIHGNPLMMSTIEF